MLVSPGLHFPDEVSVSHLLSTVPLASSLFFQHIADAAMSQSKNNDHNGDEGISDGVGNREVGVVIVDP